jgi:anthranilate synthase component 2
LKILVLDNYDSFTYNLVHYIEKVCDHEVEVHRNDRITLEQAGEYDKILISPGPGLPRDAGILPLLLKEYSSTKSILGICLGQQAIAEAFGGSLINLQKVYHGVATRARVIKEDKIFSGLPSEFDTGRYHSWAVDPSVLPAELEVTAVDDKGIIMALRHRHLNVRGVQFHPESVLTANGEQLIRNWITLC